MQSRFLKSLPFLCLAIWIGGAIADSAQAQEKITLKLNMKKGDTHKVNFSMEMDNKVSINQITIDMRIEMSMYMTVDVKEVDNDGLHTIDFTYDRIKMKMTGPLNVDFDSADKDQDGGPIAKVFGALAGQTITTKMTPQAKVKEVIGFEKLAERLGVPKKQLEAQRDQMTQMIAALPDKPVGIGDTWTGTMKLSADANLPATVTVKYTLIDRKGGDAIIKMDGIIKSDQGLNGTMTGTMRIDEKTGWTKSGEVDMEMEGSVQGGAELSMKAKIKFGEAMKN